MIRTLLGLAAAALAAPALLSNRAQEEAGPRPNTSRVLVTEVGERILVQEVGLDAPVEEVWRAYTTTEGWQAWVAPVAEVDLRIGGTIRTHYDPNATLGDPGTNVLTVVNYVPEVMLTLRAEPQPTWPEALRRDADRLTNTILFERVSPERTLLRSYGMGYRDTPEYDDLLRFFGEANRRLYGELARYLESGADD